MCPHCGSFGVKSCFLRLCGVDHWRGPARGMARVRAVLHRVRGVYVCGMLFGVWSEGDEDMTRGGASARDWAHEGGRSGPEDGGRRSISRGGRSWVCDCVRSVRPIRPTDPPVPVGGRGRARGPGTRSLFTPSLRNGRHRHRERLNFTFLILMHQCLVRVTTGCILIHITAALFTLLDPAAWRALYLRQ